MLGEFLSSCRTGGFSRRAQLHECVSNLFIYMLNSTAQGTITESAGTKRKTKPSKIRDRTKGLASVNVT
jgi:hypothetical protein